MSFRLPSARVKAEVSRGKESFFRVGWLSSSAGATASGGRLSPDLGDGGGPIGSAEAETGGCHWKGEPKILSLARQLAPRPVLALLRRLFLAESELLRLPLGKEPR